MELLRISEEMRRGLVVASGGGDPKLAACQCNLIFEHLVGATALGGVDGQLQVRPVMQWHAWPRPMPVQYRVVRTRACLHGRRTK